MAYLDSNAARRPNFGVATSVLIIEALLAVAIFRGLAITIAKHEPPPNPIATDIPLTPPAPPPTEAPPPLPRNPDPAPTPLPHTAPPLGGAEGPVALPTPQVPVPVPTPSFQPPQPSPGPQAQGHAAMPRGNPGGWVSSNDYPSRDLREGNQGRVSFSLGIGTDGRVTSCRVTTSSGYPGLDAATCALIPRRARFSPATGPDGQPRAGAYSGTIRWVIPD
ncbi:MAG: energy transducer TonB [Novosphingobium sp.]